jgi:hypothetical protein
MYMSTLIYLFLYIIYLFNLKIYFIYYVYYTTKADVDYRIKIQIEQ